jgi:branched-chain amino acid transport system permease protein
VPPGFAGSVEILGRKVPSYDLLLIVVGPLVLGLLTAAADAHALGHAGARGHPGPRHGRALGVNQAWLFTSVFALGALLAGLGGALQLPREPANLELDLHTIGAAFVVVVVGGMGSIPGAFVAALLIAEVKAICVWIGLVEVAGIEISFSKLTLVVEFLVMAAVLILRPWGLMGRAPAASRHVSAIEERRCSPPAGWRAGPRWCWSRGWRCCRC